MKVKKAADTSHCQEMPSQLIITNGPKSASAALPQQQHVHPGESKAAATPAEATEHKGDEAEKPIQRATPKHAADASPEQQNVSTMADAYVAANNHQRTGFAPPENKKQNVAAEKRNQTAAPRHAAARASPEQQNVPPVAGAYAAAHQQQSTEFKLSSPQASAASTANERRKKRIEVRQDWRQRHYKQRQWLHEKQQWMNYYEASATMAGMIPINTGVPVSSRGENAHAVTNARIRHANNARRESKSLRDAYYAQAVINVNRANAQAALDREKLRRERPERIHYPDETYILPKEHEAKISPFNIMEKEWKSQNEFLAEAKEHLGKEFGIYKFAVDQSNRNPDPATKEAIPR